MRIRYAVAGASAAIVAVAAFAAPQDKAKTAVPKELKCAVMADHNVNVAEATEKGMFADHRGYRYYFCCEGCVPTFKKEPAKFASAPNIPVARAPQPASLACAVLTDHKVDVKEALAKKMFADHEGKRYVFCCAGCPAAFKADPAKFAKNAAINLPEASYPKEIKCAVNTGGTVNVADATKKGNFADHNGKRYFFCCANCPNAFKKDPAKYAANESVASPVVAEEKN